MFLRNKLLDFKNGINVEKMKENKIQSIWQEKTKEISILTEVKMFTKINQGKKVGYKTVPTELSQFYKLSEKITARQ